MSEVFQAHCACGSVVFESKGAPLASIACYCDDCQAVAKQIDALPNGRSGIGADGGTKSRLYRKDLVRCVAGEALLTKHKLRPNSPATRVLASCCNSNMLTTFESWLPIIAVRTHSQNVEAVVPTMCINTRWAPDATKITHGAPRHAKIPPRLGLKIVGAALYLAMPVGEGWMT